MGNVCIGVEGNTEIVLNTNMRGFKSGFNAVFEEPMSFLTEIKLVLAIIRISATKKKWKTVLYYLIRIPNTFAYHIHKNTRKHTISAITTIQNRFRRRCCSCKCRDKDS